MTESTQRIEGVLPVLKPAGRTSHDIVAAVRRIVRMKRIGHTGTLDPAVTGVLPLCLGKATRIAEWLQDMPKVYEAELKLGIATDTEDLSGEIIESADHVRVTEAQVKEVLHQFIGEIEQVPPMYSAVKVAGRRLYELARSGQNVERKARQVTIYELKLLGMDLNIEQPLIRFSVRCSKGTYIRTLCSDIGRALGYPAVMSSLVRTESGGIQLDQCYSLEEIAELHEKGQLHQIVLSLDKTLAHFPTLYVGQDDAARASSGVKLPISSVRSREDALLRTCDSASDITPLRLYAEDGTFIGIFRHNESTSMLEPMKVFA